ncbi:MAG: hypothetical protein OHK0012_17150 [Synechococcales cyanobacterium]
MASIPGRLVTSSLFTASSFEKVARDIQKEANLSRIKKLIVYVCRRQWENNQATLDELNLVELLQELYERFPTSAELTAALREAIQTISKKTEYSLVANIILNKTQALYQQESFAPEEMPLDLDPQYNLFDLRLDVMRQANPLRAKVLLFSALYHPIGYTEQGLGVVKTHSLDDLLKSMFLRCKTQAEMEHKIQTAASFLGDHDHTEPVAVTITQSLRPWFMRRMQELSSPTSVPQTPSPSQDIGSPVTAPPPLDPVDALWSAVPPLEALPPTDDAMGWLDQIPLPPPTAELVPPVNAVPVPAPAPVVSATPVVTSALPPQPTATPSPLTEEASVLSLLQSRPELRSEIKHQIKRSITEMMSSLENILTDLGNILDEQLQEDDPQQALLVKYCSLREFIQEAEGTPSKFLEVLSKLETAERKLFGL